VLPTPCFVFGDAHLGAVPTSVESSVLAFLAAAKGHAKSVIVNGDLFDFWFEWRSAVPRGGVRVAAALAALADAGIPVLWHAGNHDCWGGDALRDLGIAYGPGPYTGAIGGWRAFIHHGDGLRPEADRAYRRWSRVLRHPAAVAAYRLLPADWGTALAMATSKTSRQHNAHDEGAGLRDVAFARMEAGADAPSLVVFGHAHARSLTRAPSGGVYANPGAWMDEPVYLRVDDHRVALVRHDGSADGHELDALDRLA
jgi:UDP-2,3-diacylglucosamine hydrolase